jgi:hypothetical protein
MHQRSQLVPFTEGKHIFLEVLGPEVVALALAEHSELEVDVRDQLGAEISLLCCLWNTDSTFDLLAHFALVVQKELRQRQLVFFADEAIYIAF